MNIPEIERQVLTYHGYTLTQERLKALFELVQNKNNWKFPIDAIVPFGTNLKDLDAAIVHFTGSLATFTDRPEGIRVQADGYYRTIGA